VSAGEHDPRGETDDHDNANSGETEAESGVMDKHETLLRDVLQVLNRRREGRSDRCDEDEE